MHPSIERARAWLRAYEAGRDRRPTAELAVPDVEQETDYTCGPSALLAAIQTFYPDSTETEESVVAAAGVTSDGASPEQLVRAARHFGLGAEPREGMTIDDLAALLDQGALVLVGLQAWPADGRRPPEGYAEHWGDAHYVLVTAVAGSRVLFEDPSTVGRAELLRSQLRERWHIGEPGDESHGFGIVLTGPRPPARAAPGATVPMG